MAYTEWGRRWYGSNNFGIFAYSCTCFVCCCFENPLLQFTIIIINPETRSSRQGWGVYNHLAREAVHPQRNGVYDEIRAYRWFPFPTHFFPFFLFLLYWVCAPCRPGRDNSLQSALLLSQCTWARGGRKAVQLFHNENCTMQTDDMLMIDERAP